MTGHETTSSEDRSAGGPEGMLRAAGGPGAWWLLALAPLVVNLVLDYYTPKIALVVLVAAVALGYWLEERFAPSLGVALGATVCGLGLVEGVSHLRDVGCGGGRSCEVRALLDFLVAGVFLPLTVATVRGRLARAPLSVPLVAVPAGIVGALAAAAAGAGWPSVVVLAAGVLAAVAGSGSRRWRARVRRALTQAARNRGAGRP